MDHRGTDEGRGGVSLQTRHRKQCNTVWKLATAYYACTLEIVLDLDVQIGVDFALKVLNWDADTLIRLQLWDIAGNTSFFSFPLTVVAPVCFTLKLRRHWRNGCGGFVEMLN